MGYIFDDWKKLLDNFQNSVEKDLEEIHQQKAEVQQIKSDIFNRLDSGLYYRDNQRLVLSAPEIIIGNVDKSGMMLSNAGRVVIKGNQVSMEGVGDTGTIVSRAPSIRQLAVNPGADGEENVVCSTSEVVSQACSIVLHSSNATDAFSQVPTTAGSGGVSIHADTRLQLEATVSAEQRKTEIEATLKGLSEQISNLKKDMSAQKKIVDDCFKTMSKLLDQEEKLNVETNYFTRLNLGDIDELHDEMKATLPPLYQATQTFIRLVSQLAEANRKKKALETEKGKIKTGDSFKNASTGASLKVTAERIDVATADGDGNLHTHAGAGISVRTPKMGIVMNDDKGKLVKDGGFSVNAQRIAFSASNHSSDGKEYPAEGSFSVVAKDISMASVDYKMGAKTIEEKQLTAQGQISLTAKTVEVSTVGPSNVERDENGALTKGDFKAEGDIIIKSKGVTVESFDYEVADGKLKPKALTKESKIGVRAEKIDFLAADEEGKATGSIMLNAKTVGVKTMDVDKEKLTDSALAEGSTMTLVAEKMFVGAKSKDVKSKKVQVVSEEVGAFADKTLEIQQDEGKALVQLSGGNTSIGGGNTQLYGATTINDKTEVKGDLKVPKATIDNLEAKTSFKSSNISDGIAVPAPAAAAKLSKKLNTEDAPK